MEKENKKDFPFFKKEARGILNLGLSTEQSIEWFVSHYRGGEDYNTSAVLIDGEGTIIMFSEKGTPEVDILQSDGAIWREQTVYELLPSLKTVKHSGAYIYSPLFIDTIVRKELSVLQLPKEEERTKEQKEQVKRTWIEASDFVANENQLLFKQIREGKH